MQKPESPPTVSCKTLSFSAPSPPGGLHPRPRLGLPTTTTPAGLSPQGLTVRGAWERTLENIRGKSGASPALFMAPTLPRGETLVFGVLRWALGLHYSPLPSWPDLVLAPGEPEKGNPLNGGREKRGPRRDKTPPSRCWVSAVGGWPRPGEGRRGAASLTLGRASQLGRGPAKPPTLAAPVASIAHSSSQRRPPPSAIPLPSHKGVLPGSQAHRGSRLRIPCWAQIPHILTLGKLTPRGFLRSQREAPRDEKEWGSQNLAWDLGMGWQV